MIFDFFILRKIYLPFVGYIIPISVLQKINKVVTDFFILWPSPDGEETCIVLDNSF